MYKLLNKFLQLEIQHLTEPPADTSTERLFNYIKSIEEGGIRKQQISFTLFARNTNQKQ